MAKEIINKKMEENTENLLNDFIKSVKKEYTIHTLISFFFILINISSFVIMKKFNYHLPELIWSRMDYIYVTCGCVFITFSIVQLLVILLDKENLRYRLSRFNRRKANRRKAESLSNDERIQFFNSKAKEMFIVKIARIAAEINVIFIFIRIMFFLF